MKLCATWQLIELNLQNKCSHAKKTNTVVAINNNQFLVNLPLQTPSKKKKTQIESVEFKFELFQLLKEELDLEEDDSKGPS